MNDQGRKLLELAFNPGEHVYASPTSASSSWDDDLQEWKYYLPSVDVSDVDMVKTTLVAINPLKGDKRNDQNVTHYRSFLVEVDPNEDVWDAAGPLERAKILRQQRDYIEKSGMPWTAAIYSGGKSVHYLITLDKDLPTYEVWHLYAEWILRTLPKADQSTKNPSRAVRFPGVLRRDKGRRQILLEAKSRVSHAKLMAYLAKHRDKMPKPRVPDDFVPTRHNKRGMRDWALVGLKQGFDTSDGRNKTWYRVGLEFGRCGYSMAEMIAAVEGQFAPDHDFTQKDWMDALGQGHKRAMRDYWSK
jgi:hypothetical protein